MAFVAPAAQTSFLRRPAARVGLSASRVDCGAVAPATAGAVVPVRRAARMMSSLGEDGLQDDLEFAQSCIDEGCTVDAVQDVLTRLERRRGVLALEVQKIEDIMGILAKENLGGDRNLIADAMAAAVSIFSKANDDYPNVGDATNAWTLDPLKKQPRY